MYDYCSFIDRIKSNIKSGMKKEAAIDEAIDWAAKENLFEGFIKEQRAEVRMDLLTEFDQEQYDRIRRREGYEAGVSDGITQGITQGFSQGARQTAIKNAIAFLKEGDTPEKVARCTELPLEKVLELQEQIPEKA